MAHPGRLVVGDARPDDLNRGRLKVNVAFTLPPGAYATLVVKRLFAWTLEPGAARKAAEREEAAAPRHRPRPTHDEQHEERKKSGFLARKRAAKAAKLAARQAAPRRTPTKG